MIATEELQFPNGSLKLFRESSLEKLLLKGDTVNDK